jgi:hypothetical protein
MIELLIRRCLIQNEQKELHYENLLLGPYVRSIFCERYCLEHVCARCRPEKDKYYSSKACNSEACTYYGRCCSQFDTGRSGQPTVIQCSGHDLLFARRKRQYVGFSCRSGKRSGTIPIRGSNAKPNGSNSTDGLCSGSADMFLLSEYGLLQPYNTMLDSMGSSRCNRFLGFKSTGPSGNARFHMEPTGARGKRCFR